MNITKAARHGRYRTHASCDDKPLCGGGHGGASAQWQMSMDFVDCRACQRILNPPPPDKT